MSAALGAALKKIAVYVFTDKKALKVVGGIILGIIIIIIMPIAAILGIFTGSVNIDTNRMHQIIQENQTEVLSRWTIVQNEMISEGYSNERVQEAKTLFSLVLYEYSETTNFTNRFISCFSEGQTDEELISAVNSMFSTNIKVLDFTNAMSGSRNAYIDTSGFIDVTTKNNLDLVKWAEIAYEKGWGYVWGTFGDVLNESQLESKIAQYPDEVGSFEEFIRANYLNKRTADCSGLIKGYGWFNAETKEIVVGTNGMPSTNANGFFNEATEKGTIDTIPEIKGLAVWNEGHIGIYIGNGQVIHASSTDVGVIKSPLEDSVFTHWLKIPYIVYLDEDVTE